MFWFTFGITWFRIVIFLIWGSAETQPWNDPRKKSFECEKLDDRTGNGTAMSDL